MVFSSVTFLFYFLPIVLLAYYLAPCRHRNLVLLVSSLFFYAWGEPVYVILMLFSIGANYVFGILLDRFINHKMRCGASNGRWVVALAVIVNMLFLGFFKYADFLISNLNGILDLSLTQPELPLPIGISFYTFQALSYIIDLYRGKVRLQRNMVDFATYVALFPQLIAGPIVRLESIQEQLLFRKKNGKQFAEGVRRFITGLGKKVLLANNIGLVWDAVSAMEPSSLPVLTAWLGVVAFTFQIYFDFSGYSDMAIGLGKMFGFEFQENFRYPYTAKSITDFWRRWHISLSTWFKEYVYIPLGGNKRGRVKQIRNIFIVWALTGLWHGASWNFAVWGLYFGVLLIIEKLMLRKYLDKAPAVICHVYTMVLVIISWAIFAITDLSQAVSYIGAMFGMGGARLWDTYSLYILGNNWMLLAALCLGACSLPGRAVAGILKKSDRVGLVAENIGLILMLLMSIAYIVSSSYNPFLYFRF